MTLQDGTATRDRGARAAARVRTASRRDTCADVAAHLRAHWSRVFCVPGKPVSHLAELASRAPGFEWSLNEKVAVEAAVGVSLAGHPVAVVVKHNGLALALDSLANAAVHGTAAPLVVLVGDDPDATSSTTTQDSRVLAEALTLPVLEPTLSGDVAGLLSLAARVSAAARTPVVVRLTPRVHTGCADLTEAPAVPVPAARIGGLPVRGDTDEVAHRLTKLGRVQHRRLTTLPRAAEGLAGTGTTRHCAASCGEAVVTVGAAGDALDDGDRRCRLAVSVAWPLPAGARAFADGHPATWVLEDGAPLVERQLRESAGTAVRGRLSGHLPPEGTLDRAMVRAALAGPAPDPGRLDAGGP